MTELKPCPFCGNEAFIVHFTQEACYVKCENHNCMAGQKVYPTKAEAIAAWNARAERTCRDVSLDSLKQFYCSECECTVDIPLLWGELNYCPDCGSRVVGE